MGGGGGRGGDEASLWAFDEAEDCGALSAVTQCLMFSTDRETGGGWGMGAGSASENCLRKPGFAEQRPDTAASEHYGPFCRGVPKALSACTVANLGMRGW